MESTKISEVETFITLCYQKHKAKLTDNLFREELAKLLTFEEKLNENVVNLLLTSKEVATRAVAECNLYLSGFGEFDDILADGGTSTDYLIADTVEHPTGTSIAYGELTQSRTSERDTPHLLSCDSLNATIYI